MKKYILSIDQGTTGTTVLLIDHAMHIHAKVNREFPQHYPQSGWVEHDPEEIWRSVCFAIKQALAHANIETAQIAAIGITNQRETTLLWERSTGKPVHNAIVWQDRRTANLCESLKQKKCEPLIREKTGLILDPYFSATKIAWLLDHIPSLPKRAEKGDIVFGTIDTYLVWKLTHGKTHVTDVTNASRTLLMNLETCQFDPQLLELFQIPKEILPSIKSSSEIYGVTKNVDGLPDGIPIAGIAGDQQASLFGQACFETGNAKCTYGTGSFLLMNTGEKIVHSESGLLTTVAWKRDGKVIYALEGSAFIAGAAVQWLRDGLGMITTASEIESLAASVPDSAGVSFVPAFVGLGSPHWKPEARANISGLTRGTTAAHIARACLEGIAFLQYDILEAMQKDIGKKLTTLKVDGGASANDLLMQFQADILETTLIRPHVIETTALGAAFLAGLAVGVWENEQDIASHWKEEKTFSPKMSDEEVSWRLKRWQSAIKKA
ncbi:MAG: glycerol kinase [Deltaproteobacteria bacterium RIFCSPLOWO2_02_FULL_44_10]|nr:MAG: glycerol kinase [Deltaproteobacteria bacterium RIFCSPHIGHO2_02_FULL_44_16]OGQ46193.1 MAG: glycerol kinase [Deltaproteobacteria bacterium RIFCSPLOWO2_02_FULL_44_10]